MAKNDRPLMRQKVNVSETLIQSWKRNMNHELRQVIHAPLLEMEDYGKSFEHQERTFEIFGMTDNGHMMLREMVDGEPFYWECTIHFVQMKLGRFNHEYITVNGIKTTRQMDYEVHKLLLPPQKATRKKAVEEEEPEQEVEMVQYSEDDYTEETEN